MIHTEYQAVDLKLTARASESRFDAGRSEEFDLCMEIGNHHFRFCLIHAASRECQWLEDYSAESFFTTGTLFQAIAGVLGSHPFLLLHPWKSVKVTVNTPVFTLVPADLFRKEYASSYLRLVSGSRLSPNDKVLYHLLPVVNAYNVFVISQSDLDILQEQFSLQNVSVYHSAGPLIQATLATHQQFRLVRILSLYIEDDSFTMVVSENQNLLFCNRFVYKNPQELTYLVLFTLNQLQILPEEVKLILNGEVTPFSGIFEELSRFMPAILFGKKMMGMTYADDIEELPDHRYQALLHTFTLE